jgi:hypothetical protein
MATLTIPTRTDGIFHYSFQVDLEGATYELELLWVERTPGWYLSLYAEDGTLLLANRRLVLGAFLTRRFKNPALPPGDFHLVDTSGQDVEAGLNELGARVLLLYTEGPDWPAGFVR